MSRTSMILIYLLLSAGVIGTAVPFGLELRGYLYPEERIQSEEENVIPPTIPPAPTPTLPQLPPKPTGVSSEGDAKLCTAITVLAASGVTCPQADALPMAKSPATLQRY